MTRAGKVSVSPTVCCSISPISATQSQSTTLVIIASTGNLVDSNNRVDLHILEPQQYSQLFFFFTISLWGSLERAWWRRSLYRLEERLLIKRIHYSDLRNNNETKPARVLMDSLAYDYTFTSNTYSAQFPIHGLPPLSPLSGMALTCVNISPGACVKGEAIFNAKMVGEGYAVHGVT